MAWDILDTETIAKTPRFDLIKESVRLPNGKIKDFYLTKHGDSAIIMPITTDGKIVLLNEYRHPCREKLLSLAGGHLEEGDNPQDAAERELMEETGYTADRFEFVQAIYADPPRTGRKWHFFIGHNAQLVAKQDLTEFEDLEIVLMSPAELIDALRRGMVTNLPDMGLMYLGLQKLGFFLIIGTRHAKNTRSYFIRPPANGDHAGWFDR